MEPLTPCHNARLSTDDDGVLRCSKCTAVMELVGEGDEQRVEIAEAVVSADERTAFKLIERYDEGEITEVGENGSFVEFKSPHGGTYGFGGLPEGTEASVGDTIRVYGGFGSVVVGVDVNGVEVFYRTPPEVTQHRALESVKMRERKERDFETERPKLDAIYDALPDAFKRRIDKYRANNPNFRRDYEGYEIMCCRDAVIVAEHYRPEFERVIALQPAEIAAFVKPAPTDDRAGFLREHDAAEDGDAFLRNAVAWRLLSQFHDLAWEDQKAIGIDEGHSGNSFACMSRFAWLYLAGRDDDLVAHHGAMAPLVGSDEYGDTPVAA
jgi:hypothetical protein